MKPEKSIKTKPGKSIKTLQREVRQGKQAMKTAETGAKAAKQGEKAAVQTAKQAPKAVKTAGQAMKQVPRAVKAVGQTAKAIANFFGTRADPFTGDIFRHTGVDVAVSEGTAILAAADGMVAFVNDTDLWGDSYGYYLRIRHDETYETLYAHCSGILVREGQEVKAGEPVALVGSTGNSTGSHLHFEVWVMGERWIPWTFLCRGNYGREIFQNIYGSGLENSKPLLKYIDKYIDFCSANVILNV